MQTSHLGKTNAESSYRHNTYSRSFRSIRDNAHWNTTTGSKDNGAFKVCDSKSGKDNGTDTSKNMMPAFTTMEALVSLSLTILVFGSFLSFATVFIRRTGEAQNNLFENMQILQTERALKNYVASLETSYFYNSAPVLEEAAEQIMSGKILKGHVLNSKKIELLDSHIIYDKHGYRRGIQTSYKLNGKIYTNRSLLCETEVLNAKGEFKR